MTAAPELDAERARLLIAPETLATLVAHAADPVSAALEPGAQDELARLQEAGVIDGGRVHPALAGPLAAIVEPEVCTLELADGERVTRAWVGLDAAVFVLPAPAEEPRQPVLGLHPTLVPGMLARLVRLGPRPRPVSEPVAAPALSGVTRRWRLTAAWPPAAGAAGACLEIADTAGGLWAIGPGEEARPTDPTTVWRGIVRAVMRRGG